MTRYFSIIRQLGQIFFKNIIETKGFDLLFFYLSIHQLRSSSAHIAGLICGSHLYLKRSMTGSISVAEALLSKRLRIGSICKVRFQLKE